MNESSYAGNIPGGHRTVYVDSSYTHHKGRGFLQGNLFGIEAYPGRVYGFHVLLFLPEGGAVYRDIPLHALAHDPDPDPEWTEAAAQSWDCYSPHFTAFRYQYLDGLFCKVRTHNGDFHGHYWFTVKPVLDAFSADPGQAKEFYLIACDNGRLTLQPTNHILLEEKSHTEPLGPSWPQGLKRKSTIHSCE